MAELRISQRFEGFPGAAHGGYLAGILAGTLGPAEVTLRKPVPTGKTFTLDRAADRAVLRDGETVLAEAAPVALDLAVPEPVTLAQAAATAATYPAATHPFRRCLVCGPGREPGDGLRIFPTAVEGRGIVAAPWRPHPALAGPDGAVRPELLWAALDCPSIWALMVAAPPDSEDRVVTGKLAARLVGPVRAGQDHVVMAWPLPPEGRRRYAGAAVLSAEGRVLVRGRYTLVVVDWGVPLGRARWG